MKTIFEKIIEGTLPCDKVYENDKIIVIKDIAPKAPVHLLLIVKKVIADLTALQEEDYPLITEVFKIAKELAKQFGVDKSGYRLVVNSGFDAGQTVFHLHFHLLGGKLLDDVG